MNRKDIRKHEDTVRKVVLSTFILVLLTGFIGLFIGLLIAPQSGKSFRTRISRWLLEMIDRGKFTIEEAKVYSEELFEKSKEKMENISSKILRETDPKE
jgi:gas vesicle protein